MSTAPSSLWRYGHPPCLLAVWCGLFAPLASSSCLHAARRHCVKKILLIGLVSFFGLVGVCTVGFVGLAFLGSVATPTPAADTLVDSGSTTGLAPTATATSEPTSVPEPRVASEPTFTPEPTPTPRPITSVAQLVERYEPSIGVITARAWLFQDATATGFIIGVEGERAYVVTNHHVVEGASEMKIELGGQSYDLTLLGSHEHEDVAVLSICCGSFAPIPSSTIPVTPGTEVVAVGFPSGTQSVQIIHSQGKVLRLTQQYGSSSPVLEHSAELHPGSSGSPLFTTDGKVIGINRGANVHDATRFVATSYTSVRSLIARWTGQVVSETEIAQPQPSMWVIVTDEEVYVDTLFDFTDEYGMDVLVDGASYCNPQRIYADEGRHRVGCKSQDEPHSSVERISVQTDGGQDLRCTKDDALSSDIESVFACTWR